MSAYKSDILVPKVACFSAPVLQMRRTDIYIYIYESAYRGDTSLHRVGLGRAAGLEDS
jgi:hypothetical protein